MILGIDIVVFTGGALQREGLREADDPLPHRLPRREVQVPPDQDRRQARILQGTPPPSLFHFYFFLYL